MKKRHAVKPLPAIRCVLFAFSALLEEWGHHDHLFQQATQEANLRALAILREYVAPSRLPQGSDEHLGAHQRALFTTSERDMRSRAPLREPDGVALVRQALARWGITHIDLAVGKALFWALQVRLPSSFSLPAEVRSTLQELTRRGYQLGIVSNRLWGGETLRDDLRTLGLLDLFDPSGLVVSADLGIRKPDPLIFQHTLRVLGLTPEQTAMVGPSLHTDLRGAKSLGIMTIWQPGVRQRSTIALYEQVRQACQAQRFLPSPLAFFASSQALARQAGFSSLLLSSEDAGTDTPTPGRDRDLESYLCGEFVPDLVISKIRDLLDHLRQAAR